MKRRLIVTLVATIVSFCLARPIVAAPVTVTEEQISIPTYLIGPPDPNPQFYSGGNSQGAQHRIYPYPAYDNLTTEKADKSYKIVYLENEYLKVGILPEIGGRIFEAIDKTNGYNFFYRQHVIKPALISLLGAWISGGVEWDVPHHHRATSFLPVQYSIEGKADGSKTVWVGELELRDRMRWAVGLTLRPGRSYLEASFRMINRTPVATSMLCFSNVAVHVNDDYQIIFPPSTQFVTYHGKRDFTTWPVATTRYNGADFTAGVDVSWYKNHHNSNSMFAWNYQDDFFAGYDHGKQAGTMSVADHNVVPGKKFWTWGNGPAGRAQDTLLTDADGPYIELMVGAYSDNQPDYTWLAPYETREWTQVWYPFRDIDGVKNANTNAAVNLEVKDGKARVGFCTTAEYGAAIVQLRLKGRAILHEEVAIGPGQPFVKDVKLPAGADEHDLRASLSVDGKELVAYSPIKLKSEAMPSPVTPFPRPEQIKTNEELYLAGLRIEQFHAPNSTPDPYWQEALKRDPGDVRVNTALGIDCIKAGRYADAEKYLRQALVRATDRYTSPKDDEPFYYLGLALKAQGKLEDAADKFHRSTWSAAWRGPGYFEVAQLEAAGGNSAAALDALEQSLQANALNPPALALKAALLRRTGRREAALAAAAAIRQIDPLDVSTAAEQWLVKKSPDAARALTATIVEHPATGLELAADCLNAGLWEDGLALVKQMTPAGKEAEVSPLVYYYAGYFSQRLNQPQQASEFYKRAAQARPDYAFPFQMEMIAVLEDALRTNPADARAPYYLGNLLYDWQPERAVALWEKSAALGADIPVVYRNLALAYDRQPSGREKSLAALEKAAELGGNARVFDELDKRYEENGVAPAKRLELIESHQTVVNRDEVISREINLKIFAGKADDAIALLQSRFFRAWEGGARYSLGDSWINAQLLRGHQYFAAKKFKQALAAYQAAAEMPANLQDATGNTSGRDGEVSYWIGCAHEMLGELPQAHQAWREAATTSTNADTSRPGRRGRGGAAGLAAGTRVAQSAVFYQAKALERLGQAGRAKPMFQQLIDAGNQSLSDAGQMDLANISSIPLARRLRIADAHFLLGLGQLGQSDAEKAKQEFALALQASPDHAAAKMAMTSMMP